jgi:prepilin-type processing-associated H-X9-DG protein
MSNTTIESYICPSDAEDAYAKEPAVTSYFGCAGSNWEGGWNVGGGGNPWHWPSPTGRHIHQTHGPECGNGVIFRGRSHSLDWSKRLSIEERIKKSQTSFRQITDGLSSTFAVGESVQAYATPNYWFYSWTSHRHCAMPPNYEKPGVTREQNIGDWPNNWGFHSRHVQGVNFVFCDGSVHFIPDSIDLSLYRNLAHFDDGQVTDTVGIF